MVDSIIIKLFFSNILAIDLIASKTKFKLGFLFFLKIGVGTVIINTSDLQIYCNLPGFGCVRRRLH